MFDESSKDGDGTVFGLPHDPFNNTMIYTYGSTLIKRRDSLLHLQYMCDNIFVGLWVSVFVDLVESGDGKRIKAEETQTG